MKSNISGSFDFVSTQKILGSHNKNLLKLNQPPEIAALFIGSLSSCFLRNGNGTITENKVKL